LLNSGNLRALSDLTAYGRAEGQVAQVSAAAGEVSIAALLEKRPKGARAARGAGGWPAGFEPAFPVCAECENPLKPCLR